MISFIITSIFSFFTFLPGEKLPDQAATVPQPVVQAFRKSFPDQKATWSIVNNEAKASFIAKNGYKAFAIYNLKGNLREAGIAINVSDVPGVVVTSAMKKYPRREITEATMIVGENNVIMYRLKLAEGKKISMAHFGADGKSFMRKAH
jgi:hypothetical protein